MKKGNEFLTARELREAVTRYRYIAAKYLNAEEFVRTEYAFYGLSDKAFKDAVEYIKANA